MVVDIRELARRMLADFDARTPGHRVDNPPDLTIARAYDLQAEIARLRERRGENVIGFKVGCTSRAIQAQLGVEEPIFGRLFDTGCHRSGVNLSSSRFANLAIEGELAVRLSRDLSGEGLSADACRDAIAEVFPVIELHHYVIPRGWPPGRWLIASNGIHAGLVLAEADSRGSGAADVASGLNIQIDDLVVGAVEDAASLIDPVESLRWLAGRLAAFGRQLHEGQVILTGSPLNLFPVAPGRCVVVERHPWG